jgi:hypothetical protein
MFATAGNLHGTRVDMGMHVDRILLGSQGMLEMFRNLHMASGPTRNCVAAGSGALEGGQPPAPGHCTAASLCRCRKGASLRGKLESPEASRAIFHRRGRQRCRGGLHGRIASISTGFITIQGLSYMIDETF